MHVNILELLHQRGRSLSWLSHEVECNYSNLWFICHNQTKSIDFNMLEKLCTALKVGVEEILIVDEKVEDG